MALGAFLAGMVVAQSPVSHQAAAAALPLRDAFAVLFFVSVGMLFDPVVLLEEPLIVAGALVIILVAKPLARSRSSRFSALRTHRPDRRHRAGADRRVSFILSDVARPSRVDARCRS